LAGKLLEVPQELIRTALDLELAEGAVVPDDVGESMRSRMEVMMAEVSAVATLVTLFLLSNVHLTQPQRCPARWKRRPAAAPKGRAAKGPTLGGEAMLILPP
jgi:hypothetical protein